MIIVSNMDSKVVIIPTYNEKENIEKIIRAVFALEGGYHILVIEDGSPDGTAGIVRGLQAEFPERLFMIERSGKLGLGTAYITGFRWAVGQGYDYIFEMDAQGNALTSLEGIKVLRDGTQVASLDATATEPQEELPKSVIFMIRQV